jgi:hypothetical protein
MPCSLLPATDSRRKNLRVKDMVAPLFAPNVATRLNSIFISPVYLYFVRLNRSASAAEVIVCVN